MTIRRILPLLCLISLMSAIPSFAQQSTGAINGTVADVSGAVIPGASVTLVNEETKVKRSARANGQGIYTFSDIQPGPYTVTATKDTFATINKTGVVLGVNQSLKIDFQLAAGSAVETVSVDASTAQLEASTAELGAVIGRKTVEDLPLNGREFTQLLTLTPGASRINTSQNSSGGRAPTAAGGVVSPAMHGQTNRSNYYMLDGINDNEDLFGTFSLSPVADDIQEFKVQSHNDQAQYGGVLGGIINVVTKSGTNNFHGRLWEFNRNSFFRAADPITGTVTSLNQNQFGGNIGGPLLIPHLYNGRNRTFFFFSYQGFRQDAAANSLSTVPTDAQLNGDFSGLLTSGNGTFLYNPFTTRLVTGSTTKYTRDIYQNNQLSNLNPIAVAYAKLLFPRPNGSYAGGMNYQNTTPTKVSQNQYSGRIDETLGEHNSLAFRYSLEDQPGLASSGSPILQVASDVTATNYGITYVHTFSSATTLAVQFGHNILFNKSFTHYVNQSSDQLLQQIPFAPAFTCGLKTYGATDVPGDCLVPAVSITGYLGGGESVSDAAPASSTYQWNADFSHSAGHHLFQAGFMFQKASFAQQAIGNSEGFTASQTTLPNTDPNYSTTKTYGNALASFLVGAVDNSKNRVTVVSIDGQKALGAYLQDQWKLTRNLTVNVGVRYDLMYWPRYGITENGTDAIGEIDFSNGTYILQRAVGDCATLKAPPCIPGGLASQANVVVSPNGILWRNVYNNIQPRFGFSYQLNPRTVIRGAYGIFYDEYAGVRQTVQGIGGDWPSVTQNTASNQAPLTSTPTADMANPLISVTSLPAATPFTQSTYYRDPHAKNPMSKQYNLGFQRLLTSTLALQVDYVGSDNTNLIEGGGLYNVALTPGPGTAAQIAARRPYPNITPTKYDRSIGYGNYNALEASLTQSPLHGLRYLISYTYSKTMNAGCDGLFGVEGCSVPDPYNIQNDYSVAGYDIPQNISVSGSYDLPVGRGKALNIQNRWLDGFIGGWQVNGIYAYTSGLPYTVTVAGDIANTGNTAGVRADLIGNPTPTQRTRAVWFNKAAFATPAAYTFGNSARNQFRAQQFHNLDSSVFKSFKTYREQNLQFRVEAFNTLNHITYSAPNSALSTPTTFGTITGTRSSARLLQFAVKYLF